MKFQIRSLRTYAIPFGVAIMGVFGMALGTGCAKKDAPPPTATATPSAPVAGQTGQANPAPNAVPNATAPAPNAVPKGMEGFIKD